jgi:hypothetical protein
MEPSLTREHTRTLQTRRNSTRRSESRCASWILPLAEGRSLWRYLGCFSRRRSTLARAAHARLSWVGCRAFSATAGAAGSNLPTTISPEKSAQFVWSLQSSLKYPRSGRSAVGFGLQTARWRFSVRHSRDGRREIPRRSARQCRQREAESA